MECGKRALVLQLCMFCLVSYLKHLFLQRPAVKTAYSCGRWQQKQWQRLHVHLPTQIQWSNSLNRFSNRRHFRFGTPKRKKDIYFLTRAKIERHNIKTRLAGISHPSCTAVDHVNRRIAVGISLRVSLFIFALSAFSSICVKVDTDLILFTVLSRPNTKRSYLQSQIWFISLF